MGIVVSIGDFIFQIFTGLVTISNNTAAHIAGKPISQKYEAILKVKQTNKDQTNKDDGVALNSEELSVATNELTYQFPNKTIHYPNFQIHAGEKAALVGPSGVGKTTLIKILTGELKDYSGNLTVNDQEVRGLSSDSRRRDCNLNQSFLWCCCGRFCSTCNYRGLVDQYDSYCRKDVWQKVLLFHL